MCPGLALNFFLKNGPKPVVIFWSSIPYVYSVCALLKVVGYYDFSVLSMSVVGFQKKGMEGGWGELYPNFFEFF